MLALRLGWRIFQEFKARSKIAEIILHVYTLESHEPNLVFFAYLLCLATFKKVVELVVTLLQFVVLYLQAVDEAVGTLVTRVRDNILKSKEQKNIQPTKGGHKMVTCQNYVSLFYRQITSCPSDGGIS